MKRKNKIISVLLSLLMVFTVLPFAVSAADTVQCYLDGVAKTSINDAVHEATNGQTITIAEGFTEWPGYIEPELLVNEGDVLTIDLNGQTVNACVDIWPNNTVNGTIIIKNGTVIAPVDQSAIHVSNTVKAVNLYDMEVYGQLDSNRFGSSGNYALNIYSGTYHDGNHDSHYSTSAPNKINVYGGTWEYNVSSFVKGNYELVEHTDGTYTVEEVGEISFVTDDDGAFLINSVNDLQNLRRSVDSGKKYNGKIFKLNADLDLGGINWNPIGSSTFAFEGNFYGQGHTISNLYVKQSGDEIGLFSIVKNSVIKDFTLENVTVIGGKSSKGAGALAGQAYAGTTVSNIKVIGKIAIEMGHYVGGISGDYTCAKIEDCLVDGANDEGFDSYIEAMRCDTRPGYGLTNYVGGICGLLGENSPGVHGCTVQNITIIARDYGAGGISGVLQYGCTISNCKVLDVVFRSPKADDTIEWTGSIVGKNYTKSNSPLSKLINCEVRYTAYIGDSTEPEKIHYIGDNNNKTDGSNDTYETNTLLGQNVVYEGDKIVSGDFTLLGSGVKAELDKLLAPGVELVENEDGTYGTKPLGVATIGYVGYPTLQEAIDAAKGATVIKLTANVTEDVIISDDAEITLDLSGFEFSGSIENNGKLTLADSVGSGVYADVTLDNNGTATVESGRFIKASNPDESFKAYLAVCRAMNDEGIVVVEHSKYTLEETRVEPTCIAEGYEGDITCDCGETHEVGATIDKVDHTFTNYEYNDDATCTENGTKTAVCDVCGEETDTVEAPETAKGHTDKDGDKVCDECGVQLPGYYRCKWCDKYEENKDNPVYGWLISLIHFIIHTFTAIKIIT